MTTEQFLDFIERSGLYSAERLAPLHAEASAQGLLQADAEPYAQHLLQRRILTPFQADRLLRGKWRNFIINDKFRVLDRWDAGDLGIFFRCEHLTLRKNVTLRSHAAFAEEQENDVGALLDRIRELSQVVDPHLGRILDIERVNNQPLLVMEDLCGPSLEELAMKRGPLPVEESCSYVVQAALGLQTLHEAGWIHGEARPARMIFDPQQSLKLLDASLSDWFGNPRQGSRSKSRTGERGYTLWDYAAPEVLAKRNEVDGRADVYSLGCTLYQLLAGQPPFAAFSASEKVKAQQFAAPPPLARSRGDLSPKLLRAIEQMLAKKPDDRPASGMEVATTLLPWARSHLPQVSQAMLGIASYRSDMPPEVEQRRVKSPAKGQGKTHLSKATKGSSRGASKIWPTVLAAVLVSLALGAFLIVWLSSGKEPTASERLAQARDALSSDKVEGSAQAIAAGLNAAKGNSAEEKRFYDFLRQSRRPDLIREVTRLRDKDLELVVVMSDYHMQEKTYLEASGGYKVVVDAQPDRLDILEKLAEAYVRQGRWKEANEVLGTVQTKNAADARVWLQRGVVLARSGAWNEYRDQLQGMWQRFQSGTPTEIAYVGLLAACGRDPQIQELAELEPKLKNAARSLGRLRWPSFAHSAVLYRMGRYEEAAKNLQKLYADQPQWDTRQLCVPCLALAQWQSKNTVAAKKTCTEAVQWLAAERGQLGTASVLAVTPAWWDWVVFELTLEEARNMVLRASRHGVPADFAGVQGTTYNGDVSPPSRDRCLGMPTSWWILQIPTALIEGSSLRSVARASARPARAASASRKYWRLPARCRRPRAPACRSPSSSGPATSCVGPSSAAAAT